MLAMIGDRYVMNFGTRVEIWSVVGGMLRRGSQVKTHDLFFVYKKQIKLRIPQISQIFYQNKNVSLF